MKQGNWHFTLKLEVLSQIIAAVMSVIVAIHQLLKKQHRGGWAFADDECPPVLVLTSYHIWN